MYDPTPVGLARSADIIFLLLEAAFDAARAAARQGRLRRARPQRGLTVKPGPGTPLWNELLKEVQPWLRKRGTKARLARYLGLPRQRLQDCLKARTACLDAERTLQLLCWVMHRRQGRDIAA